METSDEVLADLAAPDHRQYQVVERAEITRLLASLCAANVRISIYFARAPGSSLSTLLEVDAAEGRLLFDLDADPVRNDALTSADGLAWRTTLDGVKIEFATGPATRATQAGRAALAVPLPDLVLRLQRRNAFRTPPPPKQPLNVQIDRTGSGRGEVRAQALDVSALGMCLLVDARTLPLMAGMRIARASFELPNYGAVRCGLEVRYILSAGSNYPDFYRRCGVQFVGLAAADSVLVTRYVHALQRERVRSRLDD